MKTQTTFHQKVVNVKMHCKLFFASFTLLVLQCLQLSAQSGSQEQNGHSEAIEDMLKYYGKQIYFTENKGQFSEPTLYKADFPLGKAVATKDGMMIATYDPASIAAREAEGIEIEKIMQETGIHRRLTTGLKGHGWMMNFLNHSTSMTITSKDVHSDPANFFSGNQSITHVNSYGEIWYNNVYPNVDVRYYPSAEGTLEYDIVCKPGFDNSQIAIRFDGIEQMDVQENGHLIMHTSVGDVDFPSPVVYQKINGTQKEVVAKYVVSNHNTLKFQLGEYDENQPLIIDPIALRWATWVNTNSSGDNHGHCIWVDPNDGAIYMVARVVGTTDQITVGAFDVSANGNLEMIVGKYTEPGTIGDPGVRVWQTYIGGNQDDNPYAMEQGPDGNLYITGYTSSTNFPLIGGSAFSGSSINQSNQATDNIFIMKITQDGQSIKSSIIGGDGDDGSFDLRINEAGDVVICGNTASGNLSTLYPSTGASNGHSGIDVIVFKINQDLSAISWMKNYGGSGTDQATIMLQNISNQDIFVAGYTDSPNFPTTSPRQATLGGTQSGFIQKLNSLGSTVWSSYFQSANGKSTSILCMEFNTLKTQLYFGGITGGLAASNISASGTYDNGYNTGTNDFFVCRMDTNQNFVSSTYLGGSANEVNMMGLNTDLNNDVYIFGYTNSTNFPVTTSPNVPLQTTNLGNNDKIFCKLKSDLSELLFSTYYGGAGDDYDPVGERGIKFYNCRIYTIVTSKSNNIPLTQGALNTTRVSTTPYEPGLVVWANPPDLLGNTITGNQTICAGTIPDDLPGSIPAYVLPTIIRHGVTSPYPALPSATTYQWQISTDSINWNPISGANAQDLPGATIGQLYVKTFFRRIIGGDACILAGAADQVVTVRIVTVTADVNNVTCNGAHDGSITAHSDGVAPFTYDWNTGDHTQTLSGLAPGTYTVTVTDNGNCTASNIFTISEPPVVNANAGQDKQFLCVAGSTTLDGSSTTANAQFAWTTTDGNISLNPNSATPTVNAVGTYVLTVTNPLNGCIGRDTAYVTLSTANSSSNTTVPICLGQSYTPPGGTAQTTAGTYVTHIPNQAGCDSTITTELVVNQTYSTSETHAICDGGSYPLPWGGTATSAGPYPHTYSSQAGCDSLVTINIDVNQTYSTSETHAICDGGSYPLPWGGTATSAGPYPHTYSSQAGCDSLVTINITVNQTYSTSETHAICDGGSYPLPWGGTATSAGPYPHTYSSQAGCDSLVTINITVNQMYSTSETHAICDGGSYPLPWGGTATSAGPYPHTYSSQAGCDSLVTINIDVNQTYSTSETHAICDGGSYPLPWGGTATSAGPYPHTYSSQAGCDSLVTINITINQTYSTSETHAICDGGSYPLPWGGTATSAGPYPHTYSSQAGCDSLVTINIDVNQTYSTSETHAICDGGSYPLPWGGTATSAGPYPHTYSSQAGCDSLVTINIDVNQTYSTSETHAICDGGSYPLPWGGTATSAGPYPHTYSSQAGCDSLVTINITVNQMYSTSETHAICDGGSYPLPWGGTATSAGPYPHTYSSQAGCDSLVTINITVNQTYSTSETHAICDGGSYPLPWGGTATSAGPYPHTYSSQAGCDSLVTINITVNQTYSTSESHAICQGGSYSLPWGGTATSAGPYPHTYSSQAGCDSLVTINITVNQTYSTSESHAICQGGSYSLPWGGTATSAGPYPHTYSSQAGCDSLVTINITVNAAYHTSSTASFCQGGSYTLPWGQVVTSSGTYSHNYSTALHCDSLVDVIVSSKTVPSCTISATGCGNNNSICQGQTAQLCAPAGSGYTYNWSNGLHTQCINVTTAGTYTVTVSNGTGCSSTCSKTISVGQAPSCTITATGCGSNNTICQGRSVQLCGPSGNGYSYSWSNGLHSQCISVTAAGTYTLTVTNSSGCSSTCTKTIYVSSIPSCNITTTGCGSNNTICQGQTVQLCAPSGQGYSYLWSNGLRTQCISVTSAGTYSVTVTNAGGCSSTCSKTIYVSAGPSCNISVTGCGSNNSICQGQSATLCAPAGSGYSYTWNNGTHGRCLTVNTGGTYSVTVTNSAGCSSTCSKVIIVNPRPNSTITGPASLCAGQSSTLCVAGGTGYSYTWNNGTHNRCLNINGPGTYSVTVTNSSGCSSTSSICIAAGSRPSSTITGNRCYNSGQSTTLCAPLGTNYSYTWSNGSHNRCISVNCSGSYSVTVTNGCGSSTSCVQVTRCRSNCRMILNPKDRTLTAEVDGGIAPYSFVWNNDPSQTSSEVDVTSPGVYEVEITDAEGTIIREAYKVTLPALVVTAYPNPLSSTTTIEFRNNFDSENGRIEIYTLDGRKVAVLFDGTMEKDKTYLVKWDAKENADGVYLFKIICGDAIETGRLTLIRE